MKDIKCVSAVKTFPRPSASFTNNPMSFWRLFFIPNLTTDKMYIYDWYTEKLCGIYGKHLAISGNIAAHKSITIATHIAQIVSMEKLPAMIENNIPADSSAVYSALLYSYTFCLVLLNTLSSSMRIRSIGWSAPERV